MKLAWWTKGLGAGLELHFYVNYPYSVANLTLVFVSWPAKLRIRALSPTLGKAPRVT